MSLYPVTTESHLNSLPEGTVVLIKWATRQSGPYKYRLRRDKSGKQRAVDYYAPESRVWSFINFIGANSPFNQVWIESEE